MLGTGLRCGELVGLRWQDVDFDRKVISVNHQIVNVKGRKGKRKGYLHVSLPKTDAGIRNIPIMDPVMEAFKEEYRYEAARGFPNSMVEGYTDFIFTIWELTERNPIVNIQIFRYRGFTISVLALAFGFGAFFGSIVLIPQWLQINLGYTHCSSIGGACSHIGIPMACCFCRSYRFWKGNCRIGRHRGRNLCIFEQTPYSIRTSSCIEQCFLV